MQERGAGFTLNRGAKNVQAGQGWTKALPSPTHNVLKSAGTLGRRAVSIASVASSITVLMLNPHSAPQIGGIL